MKHNTLSNTCWNITLNHGKQLCFTDAEEDMIIEGINYSSDPAFFRSAVETNSDANSNNMELGGIISSSKIKYEDVKKGLYENASVEVFVVDNQECKKIKTLFYGYVGKIELSNNKITAELRDFSSSLNNKFGDIYSPQCRAAFGSSKCGMNVDDYTFDAVILKAIAPCKYRINRSFDNNYLKHGKLKVPGNGLSTEIIGNVGDVVEVLKPLQYSLAIGESIKLIAGCDKTIKTCVNKFCNAINFRGEPYVPNMDKIV